MSLSWKALLGRTAAVSGLAGVMVALGVVVGVRIAKADPGGPTRGDLTFAGVLPERAGDPNTRLTFVFRRGTSTTAACTVTTGTFEPRPGGAFAVPVPLDGCADARGLFDGENVFYDVRLGDVSGPVIAPNVAVTPVPYARFADQVSVNNNCPVGYTHDRTAAPGTVCARDVRMGTVTVRDEVVKVGLGSTGFWIDRFEATVYDRVGVLRGTGLSNEYPGLPESGQWARTLSQPPLLALSRLGVPPSANITWFQANEVCRAAGKRLPTGDEWLAGATGTVDSDADCYISASAARPTAVRQCVSAWGAHEMIGNLWEWTNEWFAAAGDGRTPASGIFVNNPTDNSPWPLGYGDNGDRTFNVANFTSRPGGGIAGLPAAAMRGGSWASRAQGGVFAFYLANSPANWADYIGFRCVIPR